MHNITQLNNPFLKIHTIFIDSLTPVTEVERSIYIQKLFLYIASLPNHDNKTLYIFHIIKKDQRSRNIFYIDGIKNEQLYFYPIFSKLIEEPDELFPFSSGCGGSDPALQSLKQIKDFLIILNQWQQNPTEFSKALPLPSDQKYRFYEKPNKDPCKFQFSILSGNLLLISQFACFVKIIDHHQQKPIIKTIDSFTQDLVINYFEKFFKNSNIEWLYFLYYQTTTTHVIRLRHTILNLNSNLRTRSIFPSNYSSEQLFSNSFKFQQILHLFDQYKAHPILFVYIKLSCLSSNSSPDLTFLPIDHKKQLNEFFSKRSDNYLMTLAKENIFFDCFCCKTRIVDLSSLIIHLAVCHFLINSSPNESFTIKNFSDLNDHLIKISSVDQCVKTIKSLPFFSLLIPFLKPLPFLVNFLKLTS